MRKKTALGEIDRPYCARAEETIAYRRRDDCTGIKQQLGTRSSREVPRERVAAIAKEPVRDAAGRVVVFIRRPRQERRIFCQQLAQTIDIVVMDRATGIRESPLESSAEPLFCLFNQIFPAGKSVFARCCFSWASRSTKAARRLAAERALLDGAQIAGDDVARESLGLFTQRFM